MADPSGDFVEMRLRNRAVAPERPLFARLRDVVGDGRVFLLK
jgi:hypothetical protein